MKSELTRYLEDHLEKMNNDFNILTWWKEHADIYRVLASMARDILAIPVSSVASESAFSNGGRVLDRFRSSLTPKMVECLICAQDWLKNPSKEVDIEETLEELEEMEVGEINAGVQGGAALPPS